jgi:molybdopterin molybdotransferase
MPEFLKLSLPGEALEKLFEHIPSISIRSEEIETADSLGRVTAAPVFADQDLPAFPRSTVDGFAVRAADTYGASEGLPAFLEVAGEVKMGGLPGFALAPAQAALVHTGGMLPEGANAVVMVEHTQAARVGEIEIYKPAAAGENVIQIGEDVRTGDLVLDAGVRIRPAEVGGLMALGVTRVLVAARPRVGIISSGDEVIPPDRMPSGSQVRDVNSYTLSAFIEQCGGQPERFGIAPDNLDELTARVKAALVECDMVVITAGSSASVRDLTAEALNQAGLPGVLVHGVSVKPGKPTILAVCDGKPAVGLPGNPVSALVIARKFLKPIIEQALGLKNLPWQPSLKARLTTNLASQAGREDWVPVRLVGLEAASQAEPIFFKSNLIFSLIRADGLVHIEADQTGLSAGDVVDVELLN